MLVNIKSVIAAASLSLAAGAYFSSPAKADMVEMCHPGGRNLVDSCCHRFIKANGAPVWMLNSGTTCEQDIACVAYINSNQGVVCSIEPPPGITIIGGGKNGGGNPPPPSQGNQGKLT